MRYNFFDYEERNCFDLYLKKNDTSVNHYDSYVFFLKKEDYIFIGKKYFYVFI